ncbi:MAG: hypothetical protein ACFHU9_03095 [Fluviicola sp.]
MILRRHLLFSLFLFVLSSGFSQTYTYHRGIDIGRTIQVSLEYKVDSLGSDSARFTFQDGVELNLLYEKDSKDYNWKVIYEGLAVAKVKIKFFDDGHELTVSCFSTDNYQKLRDPDKFDSYVELYFGNFELVAVSD